MQCHFKLLTSLARLSLNLTRKQHKTRTQLNEMKAAAAGHRVLAKQE